MLIHEAALEPAPGSPRSPARRARGRRSSRRPSGCCSGRRATRPRSARPAGEAYVEAELDLPEGFFDDDELAGLAELAPEDEPGLVLARRVFADGRTRAYAWGRAVAREDLAAAAERLIAMSGQFEQRRLGRRRTSSRCSTASAARSSCAGDVRRARPGASSAPRASGTTSCPAARRQSRRGCASSRRSSRRRRASNRRPRTSCAPSASGCATSPSSPRAQLAAADAIAPEEGEGAAALAGAAERALAPLERLAPELSRAAEELRDVALRLRETGSDLRGFLASLDAEPDRIEQVEGELERIADAKRRFGASSYDELLARAAAAREELDALADGLDPAAAAGEALAAAEAKSKRYLDELRAARVEAADPFAAAVAEELRGVGMGEGEFRVELREREPGPDRRGRGRLPDPAERRASRSARLPSRPRAASCRASRSRSRRSEEARRSFSTRSTRASAARRRTRWPRRCGASQSAHR